MCFRKIFFALLITLASTTAFSQSAEVIKFDALDKVMTNKESELIVINFWATWCGPCIEELPYFEELNKSNASASVYLVSLDYLEKLDKVNAFLKKRSIESKVLLLDEMDYNSWIDRVDPSWSGAIPATLVINTSTGERKFVENKFEKGELAQLIDELSN